MVDMPLAFTAGLGSSATVAMGLSEQTLYVYVLARRALHEIDAGTLGRIFHPVPPRGAAEIELAATAAVVTGLASRGNLD